MKQAAGPGWRTENLGVELFERAAEANGNFLKAEQLVEVDGGEDPLRGPGYLLTFDVGRILVAADRRKACLSIRQVESLDEVASIRRVALDEEEPWWRVAGNSITRAWPSEGGSGATTGDGEVSGLRMQFRGEGESPRVIFLRYEDGAVHVGLHSQ
jgi:hypothetical protein